MDFECTPDEFLELKPLLDRFLAAYTLHARAYKTGVYAKEGHSWISARKVARMLQLRSGRRVAAVMRAGGIASKQIGPSVFYERIAVQNLYYHLAGTLSLEEASYEVGFSGPGDLRPYIARGSFRPTKIAGLTRVETAEIERFQKRGTSKGRV